jgi:superfamily II DNA or RNA helicase
MTIPYAHKVGFTYEYFVLDQIKNDYDKVWHWKDFPEKLMYDNNLIKDYDTFCKYRYDIGADLVALKNDKYYFIQCKNYNDTILMENLAGFYFLLYEYNLTGILYYNGKLSQRVLDLTTNKIQFINLPFNNSTIDIIQDIEKPLITRDYQLEAYNKLLYKNKSVLSLPCGMGKTYTTSLMAKHYDNIIILSPLRYLAFQTLEHYKIYLGSEYSPILISLDGKRKMDDINNYIKEKNIISSTYDSVDIVIQLLDKLKNIYLIVDEFHNLSNNNINDKNNDMYKIINNTYDKIFISATPLMDFMNITDIYNYSWTDAINNKYICDFSIYIPDKNENYEKFVELLKTSCNNNINEKIIKKAYFMLKSILFNGDRKCICYMTNINNANNMMEILNWLTKLLGVHVDYWQIDYNTKKTIREKIINNFKESKNIAIIINVHILDEGINISECDSVFITQPNNNIINIIQRMCRANRIMKNKDMCNIYLWCKEKKTKLILDYINENTQGFIKNKVYIYNTTNKISQKHSDEILTFEEKLCNSLNDTIYTETLLKNVKQFNEIIKLTSDNNITPFPVKICNNINSPKFYCKLCNISYKCNSGLWRHNKKLHNDIKHENKLKCIKCNKECMSRQSLYYHRKVCKINTNVSTDVVSKEEYDKINNELQILKSIKSNNNDNQKQIIINYTPGTEPINHLSHEQQKEIMDKGASSLINLIKITNFDKNKPEFHSYCVTSLNDKHASVINTNTQSIIKIEKTKLFDTILCNNISKLEKLCTNKCFTISDREVYRNNLERLKKVLYEKKTGMKKYYSEINLLSFNNNKHIIATWNQIKNSLDNIIN